MSSYSYFSRPSKTASLAKEAAAAGLALGRAYTRQAKAEQAAKSERPRLTPQAERIRKAEDSRHRANVLRKTVAGAGSGVVGGALSGGLASWLVGHHKHLVPGMAAAGMLSGAAGGYRAAQDDRIRSLKGATEKKEKKAALVKEADCLQSLPSTMGVIRSLKSLGVGSDLGDIRRSLGSKLHEEVSKEYLQYRAG